MSTLGLSLDLESASPLVDEDGKIFTRGDARENADALIEAMAKNGVRRAMVRSDSPFRILSAMDACARAGADLYVAHTNLPADVIDEIVASEEIGVVLGDAEEWRGPSGSASRGLVFAMTSGTTGRPKIAAHSLDGLLSRVRLTASLPANRGGRWLLTYQPTGFAGMQVAFTACEARGLIVAPSQRNPASFSEAAQRGAVTQISGTPTFWRSFLMVAKPAALDLRQITLGGEAADQSTLDRLKAAFPNARITHTYASTEAGVVYAVHDGLEGFPAVWLEKPPSQSVQLRVQDGFLQIKTPNAMRGYQGETKQPLLDDGWLSTADRVEILGDRVRVVGRDDSTINVGGSKVYPLMVETFLLRLPGVVEARVFGVPNPISGFLVAAEIVAEQGVDPAQLRKDVMAACRDGLANYQAPRTLKVVDAIETRASGKKG